MFVTYFRARCRSAHGNQLAEFGPALLLLSIVVVLPCFWALSIAAGSLVSFFTASESAKSAASQFTYAAAAQAAQAKASEIANSGLGILVHAPFDGSPNVQLFLAVTDLATHQTVEYGPAQTLPKEVDTEHNLYQVEARTLYEIGPVWQNSHRPNSSSFPLLDKPVQMVFRARQVVEFPQGFCAPVTSPGLHG